MKSKQKLWARGMLLVVTFLLSTQSAHAYTFSRRLFIGTSGSDVKVLQTMLIQKGFLASSNATGYFGTLTSQALKKFQLENGLAPVGTVGPLTLVKLNAVEPSHVTTSRVVPTPALPAQVITTLPPKPVATIPPVVNDKVVLDATTYEALVAACNKRDFTMALVLVTNEHNISQLENYKKMLDFAKSHFPWAFQSATGGLATMAITGDPIILDSTGLIQNGNLDIYATLKKFYQSNPDKFDFVTVVSDSGSSNYHVIVQNSIKGIGQNVLNISNAFGSKGRLLGINYIHDSGTNSMYNFPTNQTIQQCYQEQANSFGTLTSSSSCGLGLWLHETEHQWGIAAGDIVPGTDPSVVDLGIRELTGHYYHGLTAPDGTQDPLDSVHWKKSPDNSVYIQGNNQGGENVIKYHPFTSYFMGLLPQTEHNAKFDILQGPGTYPMLLPDGSTTYVESMQSVYKQVSVKDIIAKNGPRTCADSIVQSTNE